LTIWPLTVPAARKVSSKPALWRKVILRNIRIKLDTKTNVIPKETAMIMYAPWSVSVTTAKGG
jgi:hypothetical protein